ncbi:hypothetical protein MNBD_GAMMA26-785 [hydrothermal vent metagenome]|uniref:PilZ domain-containing protein n=1 Tax=hydrothermal vent metagenome TaxID=652676 RepID=A0A3B1AXU4_9ZZZZ
MEHRCVVRKPIALDVVINYRALGLVQGRTSNLGIGGMFVDTGCIELPVNALVETVFLLDDNGRQIPCKTEAMVMHSDSGGAGLMFNDLDHALHASLHRVLMDHKELL